MRGIEKSSLMQDKIHDRLDRGRRNDTYLVLPERTWTPDRWRHRMPAPQTATQPSVDVENFAKAFNSK